MPILLVAAVVGIAVLLSRRARQHVAPPADVGPLGWVAGTRWAVAVPLAAADAKRFLRHPAFLVGIAFTPLMIWAAISSEGDTSWWKASSSAALALVPLGWATIIASNLVTLQARRTGAHELLSATPAPQPVRTAGFLLCALPAALVAAVVVTGGLVAFGVRSGDATGSPLLLEIAAGVLVVAGSVTVGVGVARFLPHLGFGVLAAVATMFIQARFFDVDTWPWNRTEGDPARFLGFLAQTAGSPAIDIRPAGWHLVYLVGLVLVMAGVALARDGVPRLLAGLLGGTVLVVLVAGWAQLRPPPERRLAEIVARITDPVAQQTCTQDGMVRYCAFDDQLDRVDDWRSRVAAVHALVPAHVAARPLLVAYREPTVTSSDACTAQPYFDELHPSVVARLSPGDVWPDDGDVHPGTTRFPCGGSLTDEFFTAVQVGSWAVGLPPNPHHLDVRCSATGQARATVALWLGAAATPDGPRTLRALLREQTSVPGVMTFVDWDEPPMWGVNFAGADAELALRLTDLPNARVADALAGSWDDVVAPGTTAADLAGIVGLEPMPPAAPAAGAGRPCR